MWNVLYINDTCVYIEIAGILQDYKQWYYDDRKFYQASPRRNTEPNLVTRNLCLKIII